MDDIKKCEICMQEMHVDAKKCIHCKEDITSRKITKVVGGGLFAGVMIGFSEFMAGMFEGGAE